MSSYALYTLRDLRVADERQAERALAEASAGVRRAEAETERLAAQGAEARAAEAAARAAEAPSGTAAQAQAVRRFWARLELETRAAAAAIERHRSDVAAPALRAEVVARAAHLRARQRREVVEKAIARREALRRQQDERRAEAAADDLGQRRRT
jgi:flagellar biosynthesis chaperone FliJ